MKNEEQKAKELAEILKLAKSIVSSYPNTESVGGVHQVMLSDNEARATTFTAYKLCLMIMEHCKEPEEELWVVTSKSGCAGNKPYAVYYDADKAHEHAEMLNRNEHRAFPDWYVTRFVQKKGD